MYRIKSNILTGSPEFIKNRESFLQILSDYNGRLRKVQEGGTPKAVAKHKERGKLLARERIDLLLDPNTPFIELSPLAANGMYNDDFPSAGIVTGIGSVCGRETVIIANDATVKGGTYVKETIKKHLRAQQVAMENNLPCVYMVDSGGVFLPEQANVFPDRNDFGRFFYNQARMSAAGIPQIAIVMGSCTAGGAYVPAMCDETIIVKNQGTIFIGGPPLVKAATGEEVSAEELGGAAVHTGISGVADHLAGNDRHAIQICRDIFLTLRVPEKQQLDMASPADPYYDPEELWGLAPVDLKKPVDSREIIARIVDDSRFHEFKANYGTTMVTGFAHINGFPVGILANNGVIFSETSLKGAHFIELCSVRKIPMIFLQNITGFIVGKKYEHGGIARDGAKLVNAVANSNVPKFTVVFGGSFGAGNYAMAGRAYDPRLLFMWPNAKISVMGSEQAAGVLLSVRQQQMQASGGSLSAEEEENIRKSIQETYEKEGSALYSTSRLWDDGIIDPVDTRLVLTTGIAMSLNKPWPDSRFGVIRM
ncbi:MAG: methylcrotonoyl-CoA carboxylase [Marinilabiliales bacterium]|nr:MAG: methylcrotonoyl-CoA carboxylase [Marinilabiliales bacterium]